MVDAKEQTAKLLSTLRWLQTQNPELGELAAVVREVVGMVTELSIKVAALEERFERQHSSTDPSTERIKDFKEAWRHCI